MSLTFGSILTTANKFGDALDRVREKLLNNPDKASISLGAVLGELSLILEFVEKETVTYLEIIFLPDKSNLIECRSTLLRLESGYVSIKGYEARGHCHKIANIYTKHLCKWFSSVLNPNEAQDLENIFEMMNSADVDMVQGIEEITNWLKYEADTALALIDIDNLDVANDRIKQARIDVQQVRRDIVMALSRLRLLQASFIASAETL